MEGTDLFLVDVRISKDNNIVVEIDRLSRTDIATARRAPVSQERRQRG